MGCSTDDMALEAEYWSGDAYTENEDVTFYAIWEKYPETETDLGAGEEPETETNWGAGEETEIETDLGAVEAPETETNLGAGGAPETETNPETGEQPGMKADPGADMISETESGTEQKAKKAAQQIKGVSKTKTITINRMGELFWINARAKTGLTYKSSNPKIAAVSKKGIVTIKGYGKAVITVTAKESAAYKKATAKMTVTIKPKRLNVTAKLEKKTELIISWNRDKTMNNYEYQYSTTPGFPLAKTDGKTVKKTRLKLYCLLRKREPVTMCASAVSST